MADKSSSELIPEGWRFEIKQRRNGSQVLSYFCPKTGQHFDTYKDMTQYVIYAKKAGLPVYIPEFDFRKNKKKRLGRSSKSSGNQIKKNLEMEKSSDSEEGTDTERLDSEKTTDTGDSDFPENDFSEKVLAPELDILTSKDQINVEQAPMQASKVSPGVENPDGVGRCLSTTFLPTSRNWPRKRLRPKIIY